MAVAPPSRSSRAFDGVVVGTLAAGFDGGRSGENFLAKSLQERKEAAWAEALGP